MTAAPNLAVVKRESKPAPAEDPKRPPIKLAARPSPYMRKILRDAARTAVSQGVQYEDAVVLFRAYLLDEAVESTNGDKTAAGKKLGLSRDHIRNYRSRTAAIAREP